MITDQLCPERNLASVCSARGEHMPVHEQLRMRSGNFCSRYFAILFIAVSAIFLPAIAQISPQNPSVAAVGSKETERQQELARIRAQRQEINQAYEAQKRDCYQKLAVTPCLNQARDIRNQTLNDIKRQEVALTDAQRKRRAAQKLQEVDERSSPQAQQELAKRRGLALQNAKERDIRQAKKQAEHQEKLRKAGQSSDQTGDSKFDSTAGQSGASSKPARTTQKPPVSAQKTSKLAPPQRPGQAQKIAASRAAADRREKELQERRLKAEQRQQEQGRKNKAPAAGLPVPAN